MGSSILQWKAVETGSMRATAWCCLIPLSSGWRAATGPATVMLVGVFLQAIYSSASWIYSKTSFCFYGLYLTTSMPWGEMVCFFMSDPLRCTSFSPSSKGRLPELTRAEN